MLPKGTIEMLKETSGSGKIESATDNEKAYLVRLLHVAKGNIEEASRLSGWGRATIYRKIAQYGVTRPN